MYLRSKCGKLFSHIYKTNCLHEDHGATYLHPIWNIFVEQFSFESNLISKCNNSIEYIMTSKKGKNLKS